MWIVLSLSAAHALTLDTPASEDLLEQASEAVRGIVVAMDAERDASGIVTTYTVEVEETLRGPRRNFVSVRVPGGTDGQLVQRVAGVPVWEEGDDVLVLLDDGKAHLGGLYTVDAQRVLDPLERPDHPRDVAELEERILYPALAPQRAEARSCLAEQVTSATDEGWSLRRSWTVSVRARDALTERAQLYPGTDYRLVVCGAAGVERVLTGVYDEQGLAVHTGGEELSWTAESASTRLLYVKPEGLRSRQRGAVGVALLWR